MYYCSVNQQTRSVTSIFQPSEPKQYTDVTVTGLSLQDIQLVIVTVQCLSTIAYV